MSANFSAAAGQGQITQFEITSNYDKKNLSIMSGTIVLDYYESILDNTIRATASLMDSGYRKDGESASVIEEKDVNLNVGEFVNLKFVDGLGNELNFTGNNKLRILQTRDIQEDVNKVSYTIDMTSVEYHDNPKEKCAVDKRYDGPIDENVRKILSECLRTSKSIDADKTLNPYNFRGYNQTPMHVCTWLAPRSIPDISGANQDLAGYFFYETADGYNFKSIDVLFSQSPRRKLIYNQIVEATPPQGYDGKILSYSFDSTFNLKKLKETGALGQSKIRTFDLKPGNLYAESEFNYENQFKRSNTGGKEPIKYGDDQDETTKRFFQIKDYGVMPEGTNAEKQLEKSKDEINFDVDGIIRQSLMRYNSLFAIKLSIVIPGDFSLRAGELIHCDFPEVSSDKLKTYSRKKSGIYMISDLCHHITKNGSYTRLNLVRDSIGRKSTTR